MAARVSRRPREALPEPPSQAADDLITRVRIFDGLISMGGPVLLAGGKILDGGRLSAALGNVGPVCCFQPRATQQH